MTKTTIERRPVSRDQFRTAPRLRTEEVDMPEFGDGAFVHVRGMTTGEYMTFVKIAEDKTQTTEEAGTKSMLLLFRSCVVDEDGAPMFTPDDGDDIATRYGFDLVTRVCEVAARLSGMDTKDLADLTGKASASPATGASGTA